MIRVGITGGIGSGKTTVSRIFELLEVPVYYADEAARRLMNEDPLLKESIIREFGENSYGKDGLNRAYLSSFVFNDKEMLLKLNAITHPAVLRDSEDWLQKQRSAPYTLREAALIFESGIDRHLDYVIGVSAPEELRISRTMDRDGLEKEAVIKRIERQFKEDDKMSRCNFVIYNDEKKPLLPQVLKLHDYFLELSSAQVPPKIE
jgi:dephospho-CoA kinase